MALTVPLSCTLAVLLVDRVTPVPAATVTVPLATAKVTVMLPAAASTSAMLRPVRLKAVSSLVLCAVGNVKVGASLTAVTVMATVSVSLRGPPLPELPPSLVVMLSPSVPLEWAVGV